MTESEQLIRLVARVEALEGNATRIADGGGGVGSSGDAYESRLGKLEKEVGMLIAHHNRHPASDEASGVASGETSSPPQPGKHARGAEAPSRRADSGGSWVTPPVSRAAAGRQVREVTSEVCCGAALGNGYSITGGCALLYKTKIDSSD
eukprot:CAMPEP_0182545476 /NCGR_PEP_ID=MMETSP1323-20130603/34594_1 /TAXON_ID=236787 /ORGANISM="Florenciella parvula, Strain RCC1693" /LENGTH=148 /DNA_ID=CAMNT_0024756631 /DNA_START=6 /DNA_END=448 /DNA_ORIENTATION=-